MVMLRLEEPRALEQAITALQHGGIVAYPTDTVYGIGASIHYPGTLSRIYEIKGRKADASLPILLASSGDLAKASTGVDPLLLSLASRFWPGSLTVAVPAKPSLPPQVIAADGTVGVRVPAHSVALTLAQRVGGVLATTSANISGQPPATKADEIGTTLRNRLDVILDGGISRNGRASTVIRLEGDTIHIIREGAISAETIQSAWRLVQASARK
ncbi:MAG: L-threonylcarbamoyladenylate synthase [Thermomicrobiales bacterium]